MIVATWRWMKSRANGDYHTLQTDRAMAALNNVETEHPAWKHAVRAQQLITARNRSFPDAVTSSTVMLIWGGVAAFLNLGVFLVLRVSFLAGYPELGEVFSALYTVSALTALVFIVLGMGLPYFLADEPYSLLQRGVNALIDDEVATMQRSIAAGDVANDEVHGDPEPSEASA